VLKSASLRKTSKQRLDETRELYNSLIARMHQVETRMDPVLFLKHNLNAQAIGALENELGQIRQDVDSLVRDMEASIAESEAFIQRFREGAV